MERSEFSKQFLGDFRIDEKTQQVEKRLMQYYQETESCDNRHALTRWKEFKKWACGYTQEEISRAKKNVAHLIK